MHTRRTLALLLFAFLFSTWFSPDAYSASALPTSTAFIGRWALSGSMHQARQGFGFVPLRNGKILVAGGQSTIPLASSELYDPATGTWTSTGSLHTARIWFDNGVLLNDGQVLIAGGTDDTGYQEFYSTELYNPEKQTWSFSGNLNYSRRNPTLTVLTNNQVLIAGGRHGLPDCCGFLSSAELFDPFKGKWTYTGSLHVAREGAVAVRLKDGRVMVAGGEGPWFVFGNTVELYDPAAGSWSMTGSMTKGFGFYSATLTLLPNGRVLRAGGQTSLTSFTDDAELYNPATGIWTPAGSLHVARGGHTATLLADGRVLVAGGRNSSGVLGSSEIYDSSTGTWNLDPGANLKVGRSNARALLLPTGQVLAVGGTDPTNVLASSELFTPADITDVSGRVTTPAGSPLRNVLISAGANRTTLTRRDGSYALGGLSAGRYRLTPSKRDYTFAPRRSPWITVPPGATQDFVGTCTFSARALTVSPNPWIVATVEPDCGRDVVVAAENQSPNSMPFVVKVIGKGLTYVPASPQDQALDRLGTLPPCNLPAPCPAIHYQVHFAAKGQHLMLLFTPVSLKVAADYFAE